MNSFNINKCPYLIEVECGFFSRTFQDVYTCNNNNKKEEDLTVDCSIQGKILPFHHVLTNHRHLMLFNLLISLPKWYLTLLGRAIVFIRRKINKTGACTCVSKASTHVSLGCSCNYQDRNMYTRNPQLEPLSTSNLLILYSKLKFAHCKIYLQSVKTIDCFHIRVIASLQ